MLRVMICAVTLYALVTFAGATTVLDGVRDGTYGTAWAVQSVQTNFGDANPTGGSELDAAYARIEGGSLCLMLTGNLENNFNKLEIFIDSQAGGQNVLQNVAGGGGNNPENDGWAAKFAGLTFDTGFAPDYMLILRNGNSGTDRFDIDYAVIGGGLGNYLTGGDVFGGSTTGSNAAALVNGIGVAFNNSNVAGVLGGTAAADPVAAQAVTTGVELVIPLSTIGSPVGEFKISAMINGSNHDYLSNQILSGLPAGTGNLGGDGAGNFTGSLSGVDLNQFAGDQYFVVPEPSALLLLGLGCFLIRRR